jgi:glucokinase
MHCTIGVDLGGQSVKLAAVDETGAIRARRQAKVDAGQSAPVLTQQIIDEIRQILADARAAGLEPSAIGMVMPGYMDPDRTRLVFAANFPTLNGTSFLADVKAASPLPIEYDADCNAAALAEYRFGAGRGVDRLIVVAVGTGIGGGVLLNGRIPRIREHIAGSLGHVIVNAKGPRCKCGARGCVEAMASGPVLEALAARLADEQPGSRLASLRAERGRITGVEIAEAMAVDDPPAVQAVAECGWWLGAGVASWNVIYAPTKVLVAGGIASLGEPLIAAVRKGFAEVGQPTMVPKVRIERATLIADAGVIGAAALVMSWK